MSVRSPQAKPTGAGRAGGGRGAPGRPRVPRDQREPQMLDAATDLFGRRGFHGASMEEIAAAAGVTKPMLYSYFESKEGLFAACARRAGERLREEVRTAASFRQLPPDERLWAGLLAVFTFIEEHREMWMMFQPGRASAVSQQIEAGAAEGREAVSELLAELLVDTAVAEGLGRDAAEQAAPMAQGLTAAVLAMARWWLEHPEETKEVQALRVMNMTWMGFGDLLSGRLWLPPA